MLIDDVENEFDGVNVKSAVDELGSDLLLDALDDDAIETYVTDYRLVEAGGHR
ncbi:hypothetical protein DM2_2284 [Halorubrum sp. DM2]|uniref:hypothetical protein n=1 Tax=Halorubrum sp. DM2 TaxID=2527867 RepID=UPI0024B78F68|nr:hypothetical protein [Halorubrum sp. DM2]VTT86246.1 hypothetical protein DM2_2284 [Halorubrum sp. DM2]